MYIFHIWILAIGFTITSTPGAHANPILTTLHKHLRDLTNTNSIRSSSNNNVLFNQNSDADVTTIPLIRAPNDLQHSSLALRRLLTQLPPSHPHSYSTNLQPQPQPQSQAQGQGQGQSGTLPLLSTGTTFLAPLTLGAQTFLTVLDTGSADTWLASDNFTCLDPLTRRPIPNPRCAFGQTYSSSATSGFRVIDNENFNLTYGDGEFVTGTLGTVDHLTFAGLAVRNQTIGLVNRAAWRGDGRSSGIVGLAYPALTAAYPGTDPTRDRYCGPGMEVARGECNSLVYPSLVDNLFFRQGGDAGKTGSREKVFALALSRDESGSGDGGVLSVGGLPSEKDLERLGVRTAAMAMARKRDGSWRGKGRGRGRRKSQEGGSAKGVKLARTKIRTLQGDDKFRYYVINVDGFVVLPPGIAIPEDDHGSEHGATEGLQGRVLFNSDGVVIGDASVTSGSTNNDTSPSSLMNLANRAPPPLPSSQSNPRPSNNRESYIPDTGTTLSFLPANLTTRYNSLMSGHIDPASGFWLVPCNVSPPQLGITIAGTTFWHNAKDLIKQYDFAGKVCISGIQDSRALGKTGISILGDVFLDSVLAVFDLGRGEIGFASRREYVS